MIAKCITLLACWAGCMATAWAQPLRLDIPFYKAPNVPYPRALVGGMGNPQFSATDYDSDGDLDLMVFDRVGDVWIPFRNNGTPNTIDYTWSPDWRRSMPANERWALLRDYNCDGVEDIFCNYRNSTQGYIGIGVFKGTRTGSTTEYNLVKDILFFHYNNQTALYNIFVSNVDIPAIEDVDSDGDMDVVTFNAGGGYVEWYKNESQELGYGCDSLLFIYADNCWGRFYESGINEALTLSPRVDSCSGYANWSPAMRDPRHSGSTLAMLDMNNDGDKELFLGDISFTNILMAVNNGTRAVAWVSQQDTFFPSNTTPVRLHNYPAPFFADINNDGQTDFLASPSIDETSENVHCAWLYTNTATNQAPVFAYQQSNFLVEDMIDLGSTAAPAWVDFDGDGLLDLVVGNAGIFVNTTTVRTSLTAFRNVGTATAPAFMRYDTNFANLQQYAFARLVPTFADMDNDGDMDILCGSESGQLIYVENIGTRTIPLFNNPRSNYEGIDVGSNSAPTLADLDGDGDLDLVVGERNGNLNYFINTGTRQVADFNATPTSQTWGYVDARLPATTEGNSAPQLIQWAGSLQLLTGTEYGGILWHDSISNNLLGTFRNQSARLTGIDEGRQSIVAAADINSDGKLDIVVGNKRGGLGLFTYAPTPTALDRLNPTRATFGIFPNPAQTQLQLDLSQTPSVERVQVFIYNAQGILVKHLQMPYQAVSMLAIDELTAGVYVVYVEHLQQSTTFVKL